MGRLDVVGIVSSKTGEPLVQFRQIEDDDREVASWQAPVEQARQMAQQIVEASMNATYDAALVAWVKQTWPDDWEAMTATMLTAIRQYRRDTWGLGLGPSYGLGRDVQERTPRKEHES